VHRSSQAISEISGDNSEPDRSHTSSVTPRSSTLPLGASFKWAKAMLAMKTDRRLKKCILDGVELRRKCFRQSCEAVGLVMLSVTFWSNYPKPDTSTVYIPEVRGCLRNVKLAIDHK